MRILVDKRARFAYTKNMKTQTRRTPRKDSSYVIYEMTSELGHSYIGLTRKGTVTPVKAVAERWRKHKSRARNEDRKWALYVYLKTGGLDLTWTHKIITITTKEFCFLTDYNSIDAINILENLNSKSIISKCQLKNNDIIWKINEDYA